MSTVEGKKQEKRRALLDAAYELFLERGTAKTSVEDITSRAKVGKGTFYLYFQDKGAVMQALLGRVSYQLLNDACLAVEQHPELPDFTAQVVFVIDHIIEALRQDVLVLRFLERNFVWPGLDQIEASREAEPLMRKLLAIVLSSPEMAGRSEREVYQRITALGSMCMSVCYSSILEDKPNNNLAVEYCKAIIEQNVEMQPIALPRQGADHGQALTESSHTAFASASALRALWAEGGAAALAPYVPQKALKLYKQAEYDGKYTDFAVMGHCELALLRAACTEQAPFAAVRGVSEGLEHRLENAVRETASLPALLDAWTDAEARELCAVLGRCLRDADYWDWTPETLAAALGSYGAYLDA